jgi:hypothetical protein
MHSPPQLVAALLWVHSRFEVQVVTVAQGAVNVKEHTLDGTEVNCEVRASRRRGRGGRRKGCVWCGVGWGLEDR